MIPLDAWNGAIGVVLYFALPFGEGQLVNHAFPSHLFSMKMKHEHSEPTLWSVVYAYVQLISDHRCFAFCQQSETTRLLADD